MLFVRNLNMILAVTGTLKMDAKIQYFHTLVPGEALRQFDFLSYDAKNKETQNVEYIIQGFAFYFPL